MSDWCSVGYCDRSQSVSRVILGIVFPQEHQIIQACGWCVTFHARTRVLEVTGFWIHSLLGVCGMVYMVGTGATYRFLERTRRKRFVHMLRIHEMVHE